ncbi:MAG: glutamine-hydrolyzing carbamoyl-phosphate synthase small subunit [Rhodanobacteraceae bacterium]
MTIPALLALADGSLFRGLAVGASGHACGEVVFNTAMTGYQEILTDPSYVQQIVTLTYPHIGNTGCTEIDAESDRVQAAGLVIRDLPIRASSWRSHESLGDYLVRNQVVAIAGIDTRRLTRHLRDAGAQGGCIVTGAGVSDEAAIAQARAFPGLDGVDLAKVVSTRVRYDWREGSYDLDRSEFATGSARFRVVACDYGIKRSLLRMLVDRNCEVTVVPAQTPAADILAFRPDGVLLGNGPGDPAACTYAIDAARELIRVKLPVLGICLGHQLLALACGARTLKMKFGHHGANHPVVDLADGRVMISSQNHGFAVDEASLPAHVAASHRSLFDGSLQGIRFRDTPVAGFQGHPEANPGPHDVAGLFDDFIHQMEAHAAAAA